VFVVRTLGSGLDEQFNASCAWAGAAMRPASAATKRTAIDNFRGDVIVLTLWVEQFRRNCVALVKARRLQAVNSNIVMDTYSQTLKVGFRRDALPTV
jgi:hypothetical protein